MSPFWHESQQAQGLFKSILYHFIGHKEENALLKEPRFRTTSCRFFRRCGSLFLPLAVELFPPLLPQQTPP